MEELNLKDIDIDDIGIITAFLFQENDGKITEKITINYLSNDPVNKYKTGGRMRTGEKEEFIESYKKFLEEYENMIS